jgi:hypothetical protein
MTESEGLRVTGEGRSGYKTCSKGGVKIGKEVIGNEI